MRSTLLAYLSEQAVRTLESDNFALFLTFRRSAHTQNASKLTANQHKRLQCRRFSTFGTPFRLETSSRQPPPPSFRRQLLQPPPKWPLISIRRRPYIMRILCGTRIGMVSIYWVDRDEMLNPRCVNLDLKVQQIF